MKKIISYITIFTAFYLHSSIFNPYEVNADENLPSTTSTLIIPESSIIQSWSIINSWALTNTWTNTNQIINNTGVILQETTPVQNTTQNNETYFVVTAYYSPLPNQQHYLRGNYEDEIILNWKWVRWASGKAVFPGMLAWPKNYAFWTKIELDWIWIWEISDRWWAIVSATWTESRWYQYDRIDVWMWFWEEWLKRALAWGKRTVKWKVLQDNSVWVSINHANFPAPDSVVRNLVNKPYIPKNTNSWELAIFDKYIWPESNQANIKELQNMFVNMWLYNSWNVDWKYDSVKDTLIDFQVKFWVVNKRTDDGAWYFWPKTREKARSEYIAIIQTRRIEEDLQKQKQAELAQIRQLIKQRVEAHIASIWTPKPWDVWKNVRNLQLTLKTLWYLNIKDSAIFWDKTKFWLVKYQIEKWIIKTNKDDGAWYFWPKTKEVIKTDLAVFLENQVLKERNLLSYKK